jgi:DNA-binding transcriptional ArsR family regulator
MQLEQAAFRALADPTRRQILMHLSTEELTIGELVDRFSMTRAAVRKHLGVLEQGHLIRIQERGRERISRLDTTGLKAVNEWLDYFNRFWDEHLQALRSVVEDDLQNNDEDSEND